MDAKTLVETQPQSLTACLELADATLFTEPMLQHALELLTEQAGAMVADVDTAVGRTEINKTSRAVGGAISRLDERRRAYVAELKAKPKQIDDTFRKTFRTPAEALKEQIRRPLDEWTAAQHQAEEETDRLIDLLNAPVELGTSAADLADRLEQAQSLDLPEWLSESQRGMVLTAMQNAIPRMEAAHAAAVQAEQQAAELERLRQVEREAEILRAKDEAAEQARQEEAKRQEAERARAEQERKDAERRAQEAEDRQKREAAEAEQRRQAEQAAAEDRERKAAEEAALKERERIEAEQRQKAESDRQRAADREHRAQVHREILADLCDLGLSEDLAIDVITAVARGGVPRLSIRY